MIPSSLLGGSCRCRSRHRTRRPGARRGGRRAGRCAWGSRVARAALTERVIDLVVSRGRGRMKGLGAERPRLRAAMSSWMARSRARHQHIVDEPDRLGEPALGVALGKRQARDETFLDVGPAPGRAAGCRLDSRSGPCRARRSRWRSWPTVFRPIWLSPSIWSSARRRAATGRKAEGVRNTGLDDASGWKWASAQAAPMRRSNRPGTVKPSARAGRSAWREHLCFAAEEMADTGDVEDQVTVRRLIGEHRDDGDALECQSAKSAKTWAVEAWSISRTSIRGLMARASERLWPTNRPVRLAISSRATIRMAPRLPLPEDERTARVKASAGSARFRQSVAQRGRWSARKRRSGLQGELLFLEIWPKRNHFRSNPASIRWDRGAIPSRPFSSSTIQRG